MNPELALSQPPVVRRRKIYNPVHSFWSEVRGGVSESVVEGYATLRPELMSESAKPALRLLAYTYQMKHFNAEYEDIYSLFDSYADILRKEREGRDTRYPTVGLEIEVPTQYTPLGFRLRAVLNQIRNCGIRIDEDAIYVSETEKRTCSEFKFPPTNTVELQMLMLRQLQEIGAIPSDAHTPTSMHVNYGVLDHIDEEIAEATTLLLSATYVPYSRLLYRSQTKGSFMLHTTYGNSADAVMKGIKNYPIIPSDKTARSKERGSKLYRFEVRTPNTQGNLMQLLEDGQALAFLQQESEKPPYQEVANEFKAAWHEFNDKHHIPNDTKTGMHVIRYEKLVKALGADVSGVREESAFIIGTYVHQIHAIGKPATETLSESVV